MRRARGRGFWGEWFAGLVAVALLGSSCSTQGQTPKLRFRTASEHGFVVLRDPAGAIIASGEATQVPSKHRITLRVVFHFRDGSIDDETTLYSQGEETLRLISDRHIQRGKSFPHPCDVMIDVTNQQVSFRDLSKSTNETTTEHMDLPPDTSNGLLMALIQNMQANTPIEVPYVALAPKPRMVKLAIAKGGDDQFTVGGRSYKAAKYDVKVHIGGVAGVVAPIIGKQPPDTYAWVTESRVPAVIRLDSALYTDGPIWSVQFASPVW
jgi:hypothetical protein